MNKDMIQIKGIRVNNLKNFDLNIPLNKFIVVTGVSGSGKSSLVFDTLYAEGQRRYVESLSSYARQFLGRMAKPDCDFIKGIPPAIAIEQKVNTRNPRSTVGTSTEIYDYLRMLFARIGKIISPVSGKEVKPENIDSIVKELLSFDEGTRIAILSEIKIPQGRTFEQQLEIYLKEGFTRLEKDGEFIEISDILEDKSPVSPEYYHLLIDRLSVSHDKDEISRLTDSIETAYYEGDDQCIVKVWSSDGIKTLQFSKRLVADGIEFREPSDMMFNFNNPYGACPTCEGFGKIMGISEDLVVPNKSLSIYQDAVQCWRGEKMSEWKRELIRYASHYDFPIHTPYYKLTPDQLKFLWEGKGYWSGINGFFRWVDENQYKIQYRVLKARYRGKTECPTCHGSRLKEDASFIKINGKSITELVKMNIEELAKFFNQLTLNENEKIIAERLLTEINNRLEFLQNVGLGYLTLDRLSSTLSGGESQRINLATSLGSSLVGSLYILDEPSIGLHPRDTSKLISVLKNLQKIGNTVVVVEHDEEIMRAADQIIDIGPLAGTNGGQLIFQGSINEALNSKNKCITAEYLSGEKAISVPKYRRNWKKTINIEGAVENNLKNISVSFPQQVITVVTGVSGSGKSTLVKDILFNGLQRKLDCGNNVPGAHKDITGDLNSIGAVEFIDQNPIGVSTRSNPATYLKAYDEIRKLFADCQLSRQMGYSPSHFSFNAEGGRCEECKGEGTITIPMQFMADINIVCEECGGKRFKKETLDVEYKNKNIFDILEMTVDEAIEFFTTNTGSQERKIVKKLLPLKEVGLGYIKLGQSSSTLSGGENQRVKLAYFLSQEKHPNTVFIFDEPTTGLHFHDISTLMDSFNRLIERGHTIIIIEHNLDVIKCADWIIDLGPEGGDAGGNVVFCGTPEEIVNCKESYTGKYLKSKLN